MSRLRLVTFNIAHGRGLAPIQGFTSPQKLKANLRKIARLIGELQPDVVALQEVDERSLWAGNFDHLEYLRLHTGFKHAMFGINNRRAGLLNLSYGNAVLSRHPIVATETVVFGQRKVGEKGFLFTELEVDGRLVPLVNLHLHFGSRPQRIRQIGRLLAWLTEKQRVSPGRWHVPAIVCGDMNNPGTKADATATLLSHLSDYAEYRLLPAEGKTFPSPLPGRLLDFVYLPSSCVVEGCEIVRCFLSDHRPVLVDFSLPAGLSAVVTAESRPVDKAVEKPTPRKRRDFVFAPSRGFGTDNEPKMSRLAEAFRRTHAEKRAAFVAYLCAGDPDFETSLTACRAVIASGVDVLELGVPFSDPLADGLTNQLAAQRALETGMTPTRVFELVKRIREHSQVPIVFYTYYNLVFANGIDAYVRAAKAAGVDGLLTLDLPPEESGELVTACRREGVDTVFIVAPTTPETRMAKIAAVASGFIYYVSREGVTGVREQVAGNIPEALARIRRHTKLPISVGFGISTRTQVAQVAALADGVVVGSALVNCIRDNLGAPDRIVARLSSVAKDLAAGTGR